MTSNGIALMKRMSVGDSRMKDTDESTKVGDSSSPVFTGARTPLGQSSFSYNAKGGARGSLMGNR